MLNIKASNFPVHQQKLQVCVFCQFGVKMHYRGQQWETERLILCLCLGACANACGTNSSLAAILFLCCPNFTSF